MADGAVPASQEFSGALVGAKVRTSLPGRVRWSVPWLVNRHAECRSVEVSLAPVSGIRSVEASPTTGSVLIGYDRLLPYERVTDALRAALIQAEISPLPEPGGTFEETAAGGSGHPFRALLVRVRKHRTKAVFALLTAFADRLFEGAPPLMIVLALDAATGTGSRFLARFGLRTATAQLSGLGFLAAAAWTLDSFMGYLHSVTGADLASAVRYDLRNEVYRHFQTLDLAQIEEKSVSAWTSLLNDDVGRIARYIEEGLDPVVTIAANGVIVFGTLLKLAGGLSVVQLLSIPGIYLVSTLLLPPVMRRRLAANDADDRLDQLLHSNISGIETIASLTREELEEWRVAAAGREVMSLKRDAYLWSAAYIPSIQMVVGVGFLTTLITGGYLVNRGDMLPGEYSLACYTSLRLLAALGRIGVSIDNYQRARLAAVRVLSFLERSPRIPDGSRPLARSAVDGHIRLDNVSFSYEPQRPLFRDLNMDFGAGKIIGIVGPTGAGKSTLLKLILRFYDASGGSVRLDGCDIRELQTKDLRSAIAYVPQHVFIFPGTIRENIAYADPAAPLDRVIQAAKLAEAHDFIAELPGGYDTLIGDGGRKLSGGERQRLAIARAFLADTPILLFDEATSAVDNETEAAIQRSLHDYAAGRTTLIVAHRLSTVRQADLIYVLAEGQVRESGTHERLLRAGGLYASFWRVQTGQVRAPGSAKRPGKSRKPPVSGKNPPS
jgi:ATP-binding cassette, subfamily B, bacterial